MEYILTGITQTNGKIRAKKTNYQDAWDSAFDDSASKGVAITSTKVKEMLNNAVGQITSFEYKVVSELPPESDGVKGTVYLLRHGGNDNSNSFDEYILVDTYTGTDGIVYTAHYEKIGTTDIDLTPYAKKTEIPTDVSQLNNDSKYVNSTQVAGQLRSAIGGLNKSDSAVSGQYVSAVSETAGLITVTRASVADAIPAITETQIDNICTF